MFIFEEDKGKLLLISEKIGSDMSQSKRESFLKNQYKYCLYLQLGKMGKWKCGQGVVCFDQL